MDAKGPLFSNIRLGSNGFKGINSLAYYGQFVSCEEKSFMTLAPRVDVINFYLLNLQMGAKGAGYGLTFQH
jgi:hypothetical protein